MPTDQGVGTFVGAWAQLPIPLVFDNDFYATDNGEAANAMRGAVATWNRWAALKGKKAFDLRHDESGIRSGLEIPVVESCSVLDYANAFQEMVGVWKINSNGARANVRESCAGSGGRLLYYNETDGSGVQGQTEWLTQGNQITAATILLNFEGFNAPGRQRVDVESLLLHELGHVLGLLHSCNGSSGNVVDRTAAPACASAPSRYRNAVMYPVLNVGQERRDLQQNDFSRVNCLYP